jgi:hypothetical protein
MLFEVFGRDLAGLEGSLEGAELLDELNLAPWREAVDVLVACRLPSGFPSRFGLGSFLFLSLSLTLADRAAHQKVLGR